VAVVEDWQNLSRQFEDMEALYELAEEEDDETVLQELTKEVTHLESAMHDLEFRRMFSDPLDANACFVEIHAGSGGTEAQDWAEMLLRMYLRYCEDHGFNVEILEKQEGEVAGIKSATIKVTAPYAYGYLKTETGVHRLVRKSPLILAIVVILHLPAFLCIQKWTIQSKLRSTQPICALIPIGLQALVASMSIVLTLRYASPIYQPILLCNARPIEASIVTALKRCACSRHAFMNTKCARNANNSKLWKTQNRYRLGASNSLVCA